ncbi:hypothetical protein D4R75_01075 [bacterium]|jgi:hypothetical protein|nr:MAG: hypothetical protein D4R75_01075 [bacterium]
MLKKKAQWKKGRGKLGLLAPLIGAWKAEGKLPVGIGTVRCTRTFTSMLNGSYVQLNARWEFGKGVYEELAIFGFQEGKISFWSFTSDGKRSQGTISDAREVHPEAIAFEAQMPAGLARMIYWPNEDGGFNWAVESKTKKGWNRFTEHHYVPA